MSITLHLWMLVPGLITLAAFGAAVWQTYQTILTPDDLTAILAIWLVLMLISGASIWTAT